MEVGEALRFALGLAWMAVSLAAVAVQVACLIHVIRSGRPLWWLLILFMVPLLGVAAYLWLEVRPSLGKFDWPSILWRLKSPAQRIAIRESALEDSSTVKNRLALADELHAAGRFDRECQVLEEGLRGAFKDDAQLLMRLAQAHLEAGRPAEAERHLQRAVPEQSPDMQIHYALLSARVAAATTRAQAAESLFQQLISRRRSEAPRYYYAEFLMQHGRAAEAVPILKDILLQYRRGTVVWRYQERRWFYAAQRLLKSPRRRAKTGGDYAPPREVNVA